ncbi:unnamed protein product [Paramecium sonneborni]|uniref:Uncharacterized protein n=1 Tax=Paramecium sonneborni TaxID=65129 RepID=A0A8S1N4G3_9CILI|nr:unnamed protein product [Paramecium sonneborni]
MNLFEINHQMDQGKTLNQLFYKRVSVQDNENNYKLFGFNKYYKKRWKSLLKNFAMPCEQIYYFDHQELNQSCDCSECGGKVKKKILICKKEIRDNKFSAIKQRYPASPNQTFKQGSKFNWIIICLYQYNINQFLCDKLQKQIVQRSARESLIPVIQLIQAQNLMKKISRTNKIEQDLKSKLNQQTEILFNKVQKQMIERNQIMVGKDIEINFEKNKETVKTLERDLMKKKSIKQSPNVAQFRIKTDISSYYFANQQKKSIFNIPNINQLENKKKDSLSILESKTPRVFIRSEKFNIKQPLTQRLLCTYLKKSNSNSKQLNNKKF